ncbi:MAG TPA: M1 family aminopeptidase [Flavobacteriales bacterium]|nr:M1 family aminopeptidase [Flavobacteriales bacterium]
MKKAIYSTFLLCILSQIGNAQLESLHQVIQGEKRAASQHFNAPTTRALNNYDIKYHKLEWNVDPMIKYIAGKVTSHFVPAGSLSFIQFDLSDSLIADSVVYHASPIVFSHTGNILHVNFPVAIPGATLDSVSVYYHGVPTSGGMGAFAQGSNGTDSIVWTLSEPYGAMEWWPCKQDLIDKIDSIDVFITNPAQYDAASNGILVSTSIVGSSKISHWKHRYPIVTYLICMAVTDYAIYSNFVPYAATNVEVLNYVYPADSALAAAATPNIVEQMQLFDTLFGIYPFVNEKYGHAQFGWGGGMEHQTMTFMGSYSYDLMAHELAHHWFGDKVTCGSWEDIWLNEGWATYLSGLCYEHYSPTLYWPIFKSNVINEICTEPDGSVFCPDTTDISRIFDSRLTYYKGAMILHTLRWVMGDANFYTAVNNYLNDPGIMHNFARTSQFKAHLEAVHGSDLTWYFNDWFTGEGFPTYTISWGSVGGNNINISLGQTQSHPSVSFFELPVPVQFKNATQDTILVFNHTFPGQFFSATLSFAPDTAIFDPEQWIISASNTLVSVGEIPQTQNLNVYPTITNNTVTVFLDQNETDFSLDIYNANGQCVLSQKPLGNTTEISLKNLDAGMYYVVAGNGKLIKRQKLIKY